MEIIHFRHAIIDTFYTAKLPFLYRHAEIYTANLATKVLLFSEMTKSFPSFFTKNSHFVKIFPKKRTLLPL